MTRRSTFLTALLLLFAVSPEAAAQGIQTGTIRGVVRDTQGLVMPGVAVTVTSPMLQGQRSAVTADDGSFTVALLPPGAYVVRYERAQFASVARAATVPLGGAVDAGVTLAVANVAETVTAVAALPSPLTTAAAGLNLPQAEVEVLAIPRDLQGIALLAPGVSDNAPDAVFGQIAVHGGFGFDNLFMMDGVEINDSLSGYPQNLYIEDAIQETQTLTSGISSEFGRFSGGVVNAISRSGGNDFSGSLRLNLGNPAWTTETPREKAAGFERAGVLNESWEGTFGGPIVRDRLWFFAATRVGTIAIAESLPVTNTAYVQQDQNRRAEVKATSTFRQRHTLEVAYVTDRLEQLNRPSTPQALDSWSFISPSQPSWYVVGSYRGVLGASLLVDGRYSERRFRFEDFGGTSTDIVDSPFLDPATGRRYNAPSFDGADVETRNNRQLAGTVTRFFDGGAGHQLKAGFEWFRDRRGGGNSLSATGYVFGTPYLIDGTSGAPLLDTTGRVIPIFVPFVTGLAQATPSPGASFLIDTTSGFVQDRLSIGRRLSADLGLRFEHAESLGYPSRRPGASGTTVVPRLAGSYDVRGDGAHVVQASYGWYSGRYIGVQAGANSSDAYPDVFLHTYVGPVGAGRGFADGFDPGNYLLTAIQTTARASLDPDLRSPVVREVTLSYGAALGPRGFIEAAYVGRRTAHLVEDFIETRNGSTALALSDLVGEQISTNVVWRNTDLARRVYDAMQLQARYAVSAQLTLQGHYTLQLRNDGNYVGESSGRPGETSPIGNYPEIVTAERHYPDGHLPDFQRHSLRLWGVYDANLGRGGRLALSGLWRLESGRTFSLTASLPGLTTIQRARLLEAGYPEGVALAAFTEAFPDEPYFGPTQTIHFDARGAGRFNGFGLFDTSVNYAVPMFRSLRPFVKLDIYNLLNNQNPVAFNTTVVPDHDGPTDDLGLPTAYIEAPQFGGADDNRHYASPFPGLTGGRTLRLALGLRF